MNIHGIRNQVRLIAAAFIVAIFGVYMGGGCKKNASQTAEVHAGIVWQTDYDQAAAKAKEQQKPMLLAFHAEWCGPCNKMKKETYSDPSVVKAVEAFVPVMIDVDKQPKLAEQYHADGIPKYVIVKPDGSIAMSLVGYMPAGEFVEKLGKAEKP